MISNQRPHLKSERWLTMPNTTFLKCNFLESSYLHGSIVNMEYWKIDSYFIMILNKKISFFKWTEKYNIQYGLAKRVKEKCLQNHISLGWHIYRKRVNNPSLPIYEYFPAPEVQTSSDCFSKRTDKFAFEHKRKLAQNVDPESSIRMVPSVMARFIHGRINYVTVELQTRRSVSSQPTVPCDFILVLHRI